MADIFISYASPDRHRAERLRTWFEEAGWSVWIDREIDLGEGWEHRIQSELEGSRLVVVLWGAEARRSEWVCREAVAAMQAGRLVQIHATGLPLLPPFDTVQAIRMQSWSGEPGHSERLKLLRALAARLGTTLPTQLEAAHPDEDLTAFHAEISEAIELAFYYCARQVERVRILRDRGYGDASDFAEIGQCFHALLTLLSANAEPAADHEGVLHRLVDDFMGELRLLVPEPGALV